MTDNCFRENAFGLALVLVNGGDFTVDGNYASDVPRLQDLGCDNILFVEEKSSLGEALQAQSFDCTEFTEQTCQAQDIERLFQGGSSAARIGLASWFAFFCIACILV